MGHTSVMRWNNPNQWITSKYLAYEPLTDDGTFARAQDVLNSPRQRTRRPGVLVDGSDPTARSAAGHQAGRPAPWPGCQPGLSGDPLDVEGVRERALRFAGPHCQVAERENRGGRPLPAPGFPLEAPQQELRAPFRALARSRYERRAERARAT